PHLFQKLLASERAPPRLLPLHELALDHHLGGNAGMVGARLPQHVAPAHALKARKDILQRVVERVTHMQRSRHIWWRNDDAIRPRADAAPALECTRLLPRGIDATLDGGRLICFLDHFRSGIWVAKKRAALDRVNAPRFVARMERSDIRGRCPRISLRSMRATAGRFKCPLPKPPKCRPGRSCSWPGRVLRARPWYG